MHTQHTTTKPSAQTAEKIAHSSETLLQYDLLREVIAERDELLEALKDLVNAVDPAPVGLDLEPYFRMPADKAWAVIAKVEGGGNE